jgi:peptidoglycan hydrolase-like protein with peptidoglycan-binding domain
MVIAIVLAAVVVGAAGWAAATVLRPADDPLDATAFTYVTVEPGSVGSSINLNTVAEWTPTPVGSNQAAGVVTGAAVQPGDQVSQGSVLYTVNLHPVVVAQGEVPAFRAIGLDAQGADVAQLQGMLQSLGLYNGAVDGKAGSGTVQAIKAWQKSLGVPQTGTAELGDVIFVPSLPTRVSLDSKVIARGKSVSGGEEVLLGLPSAPTFVLPVTEAQAGMIPTGTQVQVTSPDGSIWDAVSTDQVADAETQTITVGLAGPDGGVICGDSCGLVPVTGEAMLSSVIVTVPTAGGLVVPSAALVTDAGGEVAVVDEAGARLPVTVVTSARGMSVVEGVEGGTRVRVPAVEGGGG